MNETTDTAVDTKTPPVHQWTHDGKRVLLVKCVNRDGTSHDGFVWPKSGPVLPTTWSRDATCESGGLFGWPWGMSIGAGRDPDAVAAWIVFSARPENVIPVGTDGKVKAVPGEDGDDVIVEYYGTQADAMYMTSQGRVAWVQKNSRGSASATGDSGSASATGDSGSASATGYRGSASATGLASASVCTGVCGRAMAGEQGLVAIAYMDGDRTRWAVGLVGENGIQPNVWYVVQDGKLVEYWPSPR